MNFLYGHQNMLGYLWEWSAPMSSVRGRLLIHSSLCGRLLYVATAWLVYYTLCGTWLVSYVISSWLVSYTSRVYMVVTICPQYRIGCLYLLCTWSIIIRHQYMIRCFVISAWLVHIPYCVHACSWFLITTYLVNYRSLCTLLCTWLVLVVYYNHARSFVCMVGSIVYFLPEALCLLSWFWR